MDIIHTSQYAPADYLGCELEAALWRKEGHRVEVQFKDEAWLLIVRKQEAQS